MKANPSGTLLSRFYARRLHAYLSDAPSAVGTQHYLGPLLVVAALTLARLPLPGLPSLVYYLAVGFGAWYWGLSAGLFTTGLSALAACLRWRPGAGHPDLAFGRPEDPVELVSFVLVGLFIVWFNDFLRWSLHQQQRQRDWFEGTLSSIDNGVIATDPDRAIVFMNAAAEKLTGWAFAAARGHQLEEVYQVIDERNRRALPDVVEREQAVDHPVNAGNHKFLVARDGTERPVADSAAPIRDSTGEALGHVLVFSDVSERHSARRQLEAMNRSKDVFLSTISHELRTPLNAIQGWVQMLRQNQLDPPTREGALAVIERNVQAQSRLVDDLLDVSRIIAGKLRLDLQPLDPAGPLRAALEGARPAADARGVRLQAALDPAAGPVLADAERLQQIAWNLLSNAIKFTPRGGRVTVRLARLDQTALIEVTDTGKGIRSGFLPRVFERFSQDEGAGGDRPAGGLGLGLAITRHLVELHGGTIVVESAGEGHGAAFCVRLSRMEVASAPELNGAGEPGRLAGAGAEAPPAAAGDDRASPAEPARELAGLRIVVVDDDADTRHFLEKFLTLCGAEVTVAPGADEAFEAVRHHRPDVLLCDIEMPGQDGYALIRRVRALPPGEGAEIPAAALTAYARMEDRTRALRAGFQLHVPKPVQLVELVAVVLNLAGRARSVENRPALP